MQSFDDEGEDLFLDAHDYIRTSSASSTDSLIKESDLEFNKFELEFGSGELLSVRERRRRFLMEMGLDQLVSYGSSELEEDSRERPAGPMELEIITENPGAVLGPLSSSHNEVGHGDFLWCIRDLDSGKKFIVQKPGQEGLLSMLREVGSERLMTLQEFGKFLGQSRSIQRLLHRDVAPSEKQTMSLEGGRKNSRSWWRSLSAKRLGMGMCKDDDSVKTSKFPKVVRTGSCHHKKECKEFTTLCMAQDIQAHKGLVRAMKFSSSGSYLASGGEDCVVMIWQVREVESSCKCLKAESCSQFTDMAKDGKTKIVRKVYSYTPIVIPEKLFKIEQLPVHEFHGHTSDVLDLSWSNSDCLLSSSKDKTVRMWKIGHNGCLKVFRHRDYVTCIQFNPIDDGYFVSGCIDGKVRVWGVTENHVVNWTDVRDIVTAVCYQHDGKGLAVGSITGNCRLYDCSGNDMLLETQLNVLGIKKSNGKQITGLQFSPEDPQRVMITSGDSKVRIFDGTNVICKFRGFRKSKSQSSASFTSDGRYIISVGEDSRVYIWNYNCSGSRSTKGVKSIRSCEVFSSDGLSVAVPWPGIDYRGEGLSINSLHKSSPSKILEQSTRHKDPDRFCPGHPECVDHYHCHMHCSRNLVIVTGSCDGIIRSFHNHGKHFWPI